MINLKLEFISNRLNKMAILFDLKKRLDFFFSKNPDDEITLSFSFNKNCDKINKNIKFSTYSEKEKEKCVMMLLLSYINAFLYLNNIKAHLDYFHILS